MASGQGDPARQARSRRARPADPTPKPCFRSDLLALEAGLMGGWWAANPGGQQGDRMVAVGLLVMAGADLDLIPASFALGHQRVAVARSAAVGRTLQARRWARRVR
jgi:hypothetical protein